MMSRATRLRSGSVACRAIRLAGLSDVGARLTDDVAALVHRDVAHEPAGLVIAAAARLSGFGAKNCRATMGLSCSPVGSRGGRLRAAGTCVAWQSNRNCKHCHRAPPCPSPGCSEVSQRRPLSRLIRCR